MTKMINLFGDYKIYYFHKFIIDKKLNTKILIL